MATTSPTVVRINAKLAWKVQPAQGGNYVAICKPLGLAIQSETWSNLMEDIALTLDAMLKDLLESNDLDKFLRDHGWTLVGSIPNRREDLHFDLPFFPVMMGSHGSKRNLHQ